MRKTSIVAKRPCSKSLHMHASFAVFGIAHTLHQREYLNYSKSQVYWLKLASTAWYEVQIWK